MGRDKLVEGRDYYLERGKWVFTAHFLLNRGYCCHSGCRHCPYGADVKIEPGEYIWRSKDTDYPVTVIECMGKGPDGRLYVKIAGSDSAVPADELKKVNNVQSRRPPAKRLL